MPGRFPLVAVNKDDPKRLTLKDIRDGNYKCSLTNYILTGNPLVPKSGPWVRNEVPKAAKKAELPASGSNEEQQVQQALLQDLVGLLKSQEDSELKIKKSTHRSEGRETNKLSAKITHSPQVPELDKNKKVTSAKPDHKSRKGSVSFDDSVPSGEELGSSSAVDSGKPKAQGKKGKDKGKGLATLDTAPANHSTAAASGGMEWTPSDDAIILSMKEGGETWANIGNAVSRSKGEVQKRFKELMANKGDTGKGAATPTNKGKGQMPAEESTVKDVVRHDVRPEPERPHSSYHPPPEQANHTHRRPESFQGFPPLEQPNHTHRRPESFQGFPPPVNDYFHKREYYPPAPYNYPQPPVPYGYPHGPMSYPPGPVQYIHPPTVAAVYPVTPYLPPEYGNRHHYDEDIVHGSPRPSTRVRGGSPDLVWFAHDGPAVKEITSNGVLNTWIRCYTGDEVILNGKALREPPNGWRNDRHKKVSSPDGKKHVIKVKCNSGEGVWVMATRMDEPSSGWGNWGRGYDIVDVNRGQTGDWDHSNRSRPADGDQNKSNRKSGPPNGDWGSGSNKAPSVNGGWGGGSNKPPSVNGDWGGGSNKPPSVNGDWGDGRKKAPSVNGDWGGGSNKAASVKDWVVASNKAASVNGGWDTGSNKGGSAKGGGWGDDNGSKKGGSSGGNEWGANNNGGGFGNGGNKGDGSVVGSGRGSNKGSGSVIGVGSALGWGDNNVSDGGPSGATGGDWGENNNNGGGNSGTNGGGWGENNKSGGGSGATGGDWGGNNNNGGGNGNDWGTGNTNADNGPTQDDWGDGKKSGGGNSASNGSNWGNGDTNADNNPGKDDWGDTANNKTSAAGSSTRDGKYSRSAKRRQKSGTGRAPPQNCTNRKSESKSRKHNFFDDGGSKNSKDDDNASQASWNMPFMIDSGFGSFSPTGSKKNQVSSPTAGYRNASAVGNPGARKRLDESMLNSYIQNWRGVEGTKPSNNNHGWDNNNGGNKDQDWNSSGNNGDATDWNNPGPSQQPSGGW